MNKTTKRFTLKQKTISSAVDSVEDLFSPEKYLKSDLIPQPIGSTTGKNSLTDDQICDLLTSLKHISKNDKTKDLQVFLSELPLVEFSSKTMDSAISVINYVLKDRSWENEQRTEALKKLYFGIVDKPKTLDQHVELFKEWPYLNSTILNNSYEEKIKIFVPLGAYLKYFVKLAKPGTADYNSIGNRYSKNFFKEFTKYFNSFTPVDREDFNVNDPVSFLGASLNVWKDFDRCSLREMALSFGNALGYEGKGESEPAKKKLFFQFVERLNLETGFVFFEPGTEEYSNYLNYVTQEEFSKLGVFTCGLMLTPEDKKIRLEKLSKNWKFFVKSLKHDQGEISSYTEKIIKKNDFKNLQPLIDTLLKKGEYVPTYRTVRFAYSDFGMEKACEYAKPFVKNQSFVRGEHVVKCLPLSSFVKGEIDIKDLMHIIEKAYSKKAFKIFQMEGNKGQFGVSNTEGDIIVNCLHFIVENYSLRKNIDDEFLKKRADYLLGKINFGPSRRTKLIIRDKPSLLKRCYELGLISEDDATTNVDLKPRAGLFGLIEEKPVEIAESTENLSELARKPSNEITAEDVLAIAKSEDMELLKQFFDVTTAAGDKWKKHLGSPEVYAEFLKIFTKSSHLKNSLTNRSDHPFNKAPLPSGKKIDDVSLLIADKFFAYEDVVRGVDKLKYPLSSIDFGKGEDLIGNIINLTNQGLDTKTRTNFLQGTAAQFVNLFKNSDGKYDFQAIFSLLSSIDQKHVVFKSELPEVFNELIRISLEKLKNEYSDVDAKILAKAVFNYDNLRPATDYVDSLPSLEDSKIGGLSKNAGKLLKPVVEEIFSLIMQHDDVMEIGITPSDSIYSSSKIIASAVCKSFSKNSVGFPLKIVEQYAVPLAVKAIKDGKLEDFENEIFGAYENELLNIDYQTSYLGGKFSTNGHRFLGKRHDVEDFHNKILNSLISPDDDKNWLTRLFSYPFSNAKGKNHHNAVIESITTTVDSFLNCPVFSKKSKTFLVEGVLAELEKERVCSQPQFSSLHQTLVGTVSSKLSWHDVDLFDYNPTYKAEALKRLNDKLIELISTQSTTNYEAALNDLKDGLEELSLSKTYNDVLFTYMKLVIDKKLPSMKVMDIFKKTLGPDDIKKIVVWMKG